VSEHKGILILAEITEEGQPAPITLELLGIGGKLAAAAGEELAALLMGSGLGQAAADIARYGAGTVYMADDPGLAAYNPESYLFVLQGLCEQLKPAVVLAGHTPLGQDLAPRLAFGLGTGLVTDCVELSWDAAQGLLASKPVYGGNALAVYASESRPLIAAVRPRVGEPSEPSATPGNVAGLDIQLPHSRLEVTESVREEGEGVKLEEASVVVSGGRGIGGPAGFEKLREVAELLGGAVGASRPPCDAEWISSTAQVGITGKLVAPDLYLAVAISGSSQHLSGMSDSRNIVAINRDPDAYIFKVAHYGVVGDWQQVLPAFSSKLAELVRG